MSKNINLINKGVFALAVVGITGVAGAANFAQAAPDSSTPGYANSGQAVSALARTFHAQNLGSGRDFSVLVREIQASYKSDNSNGVGPATAKAPKDIEAKFATATANYDAAIASALNTFTTAVDGHATAAESKDQFITKFDASKAVYLNELNAAKDAYSDMVNRSGNNKGKDKFINNYDKALSDYSNKLEVTKNEFANSVNNL